MVFTMCQFFFFFNTLNWGKGLESKGFGYGGKIKVEEDGEDGIGDTNNEITMFKVGMGKNQWVMVKRKVGLGNEHNSNWGY